MGRLLSTSEIPAQSVNDAEDSDPRGRPVPQPADHDQGHDHAWRRMPAQRGAEFAEYRCDLCALSYSE